MDEFEKENFKDIFRLTEYWKFLPPRFEFGTISDESASFVVAMLGPVVYTLCFLSEGAKQSNEKVFVAIHPTWIARKVYKNISLPQHHSFIEEGQLLLLKRGICIENVSIDSKVQKRFLIKTFSSPAPIGYFMNLLSMTGWREEPAMIPLTNQAFEFEKKCLCAMSSSTWIEPHINDKLFTRLLLREKGVNVPDFVGFRTGHCQNGVKEAFLQKFAYPCGPITTIYKEANNIISRDVIDLVENRVSDFLNRYYKYNEVVVKPSGSKYCSGDGVKIFTTTSDSKQDIIDHVIKLLHSSSGDDSVLIDGRIVPPKLHYKNPENETPTEYDWVIRVICTRNISEDAALQPVSTESIVKVGKWGVPVSTSTENGFWAGVNPCFKQIGITDTDMIARKLNEVGTLSFSAWDTLFENLNVRHPQSDEPYRAKTDILSLDVMILMNEYSKTFIPLVIEINDHDSAGADAFDVLEAESKGKSVHFN